MTVHVIHLTTAHSRFDTRIFLKECRTLVSLGYRVTLVVADGLRNEVVDGVSVVGVAKSTGRKGRMFAGANRVCAAALELKGDIYHLHDPELLRVAMRLKRSGGQVIFDAHEDLPKQILTKYYLWKGVRQALSIVVDKYVNHVCSRLDAVVAATPAIREKYSAINARTVEVNNYPLIGELAPAANDSIGRKRQVCFVGGMTRIRGLTEILHAMALVEEDVKLVLAGPFSEPGLAEELKSSEGWSKATAVGTLGREGVRDVLASSVAGLVTFLPAPNHLDAQPNKLFEYMSAGVPVIASNFSLWCEIVEGSDCGLCVDPCDPSDIARAISLLVNDASLASRLGSNGKRAVVERYNWEVEALRLRDLYIDLRNSASRADASAAEAGSRSEV